MQSQHNLRCSPIFCLMLLSLRKSSESKECSACTLEKALQQIESDNTAEKRENEERINQLDNELGCTAVDKVALIVCNANYKHLPRLKAPMADGGTLSEILVLSAVDKVALIVCNANYKHLPRLKAPMADGGTLSEILVGLGFKTVTLADLNHNEMLAVIKEYCDMLSVGVYALFYFTGHGVEVAGQCYLFPVDAEEDFTATDCICSQQVLSQMQEMSPSLNVILLDMCRRYDASGGDSAFEVTGQANGVFIHYLKNYLNQTITVPKIMEMVMEDIAKDPLVSDVQFPEVRHNLSLPRSLADPYSVGRAH